MRFTKLLVPPPTTGSFVHRTRFDGYFQNLTQARATIVCAPGGFGKTTLLRDWAERLRGAARVAWLTLDHHDGSPVACIEALAGSLTQVLPAFGATVRELLDRGVETPHRLAAALANETFAHASDSDVPLVIFLDDVHAVVHQPGVGETLGEFLRGAGDRVHLVFASRTPLKFAPLAKLRAAGALQELAENDLRFTVDEAEALVADHDAAVSYVAHTEGWAIALGLLAQMARTNPHAWQGALERSRESVFDFLTEEVVAYLPEPTTQALYALAVPAVIDAAAARELCDIDDIAQFMNGLAAHGLPMAQLDEGTWRMHGMLRHFLADRLARNDPERARSLRSRYAGLLRREGRKLEALQQLLEANEYEEIVPYAAEAIVTIRYTDGYRTFLRLLAQVPDDVLRRKPMLHRFFAMALLRDRRNADAEEQLQLCYERAIASENYETACVAQLELGIIADRMYYTRRGEFARSEACFRKALELAERPELRDRPHMLNLANWHLGMVFAARSQFERAFEHFEIAERIERSSTRHVELLFVEIAIVHGWKGDWRRSLQYAELAEESFRSGGGEFQIGSALVAQTQAMLTLREDPHRTIELAKATIQTLTGAQKHDELAAAYVLLGHAFMSLPTPEVDNAATALREGRDRLAHDPQPTIAFDAELLACSLAIVTARFEDARAACDAAYHIAGETADPWQLGMATFYEGAFRLSAGDEGGARERFAGAVERLTAVHDAYNVALARSALLACDARGGTLQSHALQSFLESLRVDRLEYAMRSAPRSAALLLAWSLRNGHSSRDAAALLAEGAAGYAEPLEEVARDATCDASARATAVRILSKACGAAARPLLQTLEKDPDSLVATTAKTALELLPAPDVPFLEIGVVGTLRVRIAGTTFDERDARFERKRAAELLRFLALSGCPVTKSAVMSALWPDNAGVADTTLRVTLHALRRALQPALDGSGDYVEYDGTTLRLRPDLVAGVDAREAEVALRRAELLLARRELPQAREMVERSIATLAQSPREDDVAEWLRPYVRAWRDRCVEAYLCLASIERKEGDGDAALRAAERAVACDPLSEEAVHMLLDVLVEAGQLDSARAAFASYRKRLSQQLGTTPGAALLERYSQLLAQRQEARTTSALSERELQVLGLIAQGLSNKQIGAKLSLSTWTVNNHVAKILRKLNVESRIAAISAAGMIADS